MDPEIKRELEEIHALAKDNHQILRNIRRGQMFSFIGKIIIWAIVLALPLYFYQEYLQPLVSQFSTDKEASTTGSFGLPSSELIQNLINSYKPQ
ncbi:MAG: hypothetical protein Q8L30_01035 [bacterium]|nr:hypothetical protein [bacterium]